MDRPVIFIVRDHINMLTDLGKDWASGPPSDFDTFVPINYAIYITLSEYELNLYANDHNIIDRPLDKRDNSEGISLSSVRTHILTIIEAIFTLSSSLLTSMVSVPSNTFRPMSPCIPFCVETGDVSLVLNLPRWNIYALSSHSVEQISEFGQVTQFRLDGSYTYFAEIRSDCIDMLKLDIHVRPAVKECSDMSGAVTYLSPRYLLQHSSYSDGWYGMLWF